MASVVNNLRVDTSEVKKIFFNKFIMKELYFNGVLIWKNANPFVFTKKLANIDLSTFGTDTIIFEGFSENEFTGSYNLVENAEVEKPNLIKGQMVVETTDGEKE
jgi:hypothetical protein